MTRKMIESSLLKTIAAEAMDKYVSSPPDDSFTANAFAIECGLSVDQARKRLRAMIDCGRLQRSLVKLPRENNPVYYYWKK